VYKYLALCYEKIGNEAAAEANFQKALLLDPNDPELIKKVSASKKNRDSENKQTDISEPKNDFEVEQGEKIGLPINKSAYEIRLDEKEGTPSHQPLKN
jgi:Tfp pilus assembly protein PilF